MFLVISRKGNLIGVLDTSDGVTEYFTEEQLRSIRTKIDIGGISPSGKIYCKSESVLTDFINEAQSLIARYLILKVDDKTREYENILNIARKYGLAEESKDISFDFKNKSLILHKLGIVVPYESADNLSIVTELDVCDKDVVKLSRLGSSAFDYITIYIGNYKYKLSYLLDLLNLISVQLRYDNIFYIGITPSNKMFKVILLFKGQAICVSVKFDTLGVLRRDFHKIISAKVDSFGNFIEYARRYVASNKPDTEAVITKVTVKSMTSWTSKELYKRIKEKYKTLQDVYIGFSE